MPGLKYLEGVTTLKLDVDTCIGCGSCIDVCPHAVFILEDRKARIVDLHACMECGACALNCPVDAISVRSGVGCAAAIIEGKLRGLDEPVCGCGDDDESTLCC